MSREGGSGASEKREESHAEPGYANESGLAVSLFYAFLAALWMVLSGLTLAAFVHDIATTEKLVIYERGLSWPLPPCCFTVPCEGRCHC